MRHLPFMRRLPFICLVVASALSLAACAGSRPIAVLTSKGQTLRGAVSRAGFDTAFTISGGRLVCSGVYPLVGEAKVVTVTMHCSDGRSGIALVTHQDAFNGGGTVRFSDGTEGTFVFGDGAAAI